MGNFLLYQGSGHHTDCSSALTEASIGNPTHQADFAAAVHELNSALGQEPPHVIGHLCISWLNPKAGPAEHTHAL
jgi:hypothetical protein